MKSKWTLFAGILLLILGIILRKAAGLGTEGLIFLFGGLAMFMTGLYIRPYEPPFNPSLLIVPGILLKILFIVLFIIKVRKTRKALEVSE